METGSKVAVVAPSGYVDINNIQNAIGVLNSWGLNTIEGDSLYKRNGIFAGTDSERLADLQTAIDDKDIKAIVCARGGYGLSRIIDRLDLKALQEFPKWICGFSDITILHYYVMKELAMPVIHSPMLLSFARRADSESIDSLREILFEGRSAFQWDSDNLQNGETKSVLAGGNLSLLYSLLGVGLSDYLAGKILFIEDTGEHLYRLDRMLMSLRLAGVFKRISGLIVGGISDISENDNNFGAGIREIVLNALGRDDIPVAFDFPAGHIADNRAFYLGREYFFRVDTLNAVLSCLDC